MGNICTGTLCIPQTIDAWLVRQLELKVETGVNYRKVMDLPSDHNALEAYEMTSWRDLIYSVHLPFMLSDRRLSLAAIDSEWRHESFDVLRRSIGIASQLGAAQVVVHAAPYRWDGHVVGSYENLIQGLQRVGKLAEEYNLLVCVENNRTYWDGCDPAQPADEIDRSEINEYFADTPEKWLSLVKDIDADNVRLCLDTSHAVTTAHRSSSLDGRLRIMEEFLAAKEWIAHVHWNDNFLFDSRGRDDEHQLLSVGSIPIDIHSKISRLPASKHLEHRLNSTELIASLQFIRKL